MWYNCLVWIFVLPKSTVMEIHMGKLVKEILENRKIKQRIFLNVLGDESRVSKLMRTADWRLTDVSKASEALHYNLFAHFVKGGKTDMLLEDSPLYVTKKQEKEIAVATSQINEQKDLLNMCRESNKLLQEKVRALQLELNKRQSGKRK